MKKAGWLAVGEYECVCCLLCCYVVVSCFVVSVRRTSCHVPRLVTMRRKGHYDIAATESGPGGARRHETPPEGLCACDNRYRIRFSASLTY
mmetsp:Transcript_51792/g.130042  ORF Transcript_51792/g.130042 Transcript_51792/m.130042 type:complete len:91 (-) Transcript_51792:62-334(-)